MPRPQIYLALFLAATLLAGEAAAHNGGPDFAAARSAGRSPQGAGAAESLGRLLGNVPTGSRLEARLWADAADGRLDSFKLAEAALIAGGVNDEQALAHDRELFAQWSAAIKGLDRPSDPLRRRAAVVLVYLHDKILTGGYRLEATDLARVFDRREFNCVSATVMYLALSAEIGLPAVAIELPTHACCRVETASDAFDVETTCRRWFEIIDDPIARAAVQRRVAGPQGGAAASRRTISTVELLAVIYYNQGVELIGRHADAAAVDANLNALRLDPAHDGAERNLWVAVNNSALDRCREGQFAEAADALGRARRAVPDHPTLKHNELYVYQQWALTLCRENRYGEALGVIDAGLKMQPAQPVLTAYRRAVQTRLGGEGGAGVKK